MCAVRECRACTLNMNWLHWQQTTVLYCAESVPLTKAEKVREGEMWARQIVQPTDIHSPDGKMEIYSFLSVCPPPPPFNQTYYRQLIPFSSVSELFCILPRKSFISLKCYCLSCMSEDHSGNRFLFFFFLFSSPDLLFISSINLHQSLQQHIYFHCSTFCHHTV